MVVPNFTPFAKDPAALTGGISLYLSTPKADYLNGCFISVNCMFLTSLLARLRA